MDGQRRHSTELLHSAVKVEVALNRLPKVSKHNKLTPFKRSSTSEVSTSGTNCFFLHVFPGFYHQLPQNGRSYSIKRYEQRGIYTIILKQFQPRPTTSKVIVSKTGHTRSRSFVGKLFSGFWPFEFQEKHRNILKKSQNLHHFHPMIRYDDIRYDYLNGIPYIIYIHIIIPYAFHIILHGPTLLLPHVAAHRSWSRRDPACHGCC